MGGIWWLSLCQGVCSTRTHTYPGFPPWGPASQGSLVQAARVTSPSWNGEEVRSAGWVRMRWLLASGGHLGQPLPYYSHPLECLPSFPKGPLGLKPAGSWSSPSGSWKPQSRQRSGQSLPTIQGPAPHRQGWGSWAKASQDPTFSPRQSAAPIPAQSLLIKSAQMVQRALPA